MSADAFSQLAVLYGWFMLAGLVVFLTLIARFYQRFAGERTYFWLFPIPILLFGLQAVRQTNYPDDPLSDLLAAVAGLLLIGMCVFLYWRMTAGRQGHAPE